MQRRQKERKGPYVFHYKDGSPIGSYKTAWKTALTTAGLKGKLFHDFRHTAATALRRAGVPEEVAMKITGYVTNSMFRRYRIVDDSDVKGALEQRAAYETVRLAEARAKAKAAAQQAALDEARLAKAAGVSARVQ